MMIMISNKSKFFQETSLITKGRCSMEETKVPNQNEPAKKVYEKPMIISEEVFETLALACCKSDACRKYGFPRGLHGVS